MNLEAIFKDIIEKSNIDTIKIANLVIDYCNNNKIDITNLKLLKLLYFINIENLNKTNGKPIFKEEFLAWRHGPVLLSVYDYFKFGIIYPNINEVEKIKLSFNQQILSTIDEVLKKLAKVEVWKLVEKSHEDNSPWYKVYHANKDEHGICEAPISHSDIFNYYKDI
ncbi:MAG: DUF4065 domain-containing protein [Bacilli bacterium]|nr:DUF4065 domain-containing protein [Bacilli bacterium]